MIRLLMENNDYNYDTLNKRIILTIQTIRDF